MASENPQQNGGAAPSTVDPALAQEAQIPLQSFALPTFPPEASNLKALTLTSDIKLDEYSSQLEKAVPPVPELPLGIQALTLELFALGYPPGFLKALADRLPSLRSLVVYSQLLAGTTEESHKDALAFFEKVSQSGLNALHLLDVFARTGFFTKVGSILEKNLSGGLRFLEVNYSYRHEDDDFLDRVPGMDLLSLIGPNLLTCALNLSKADVTDDPDDPSNLDQEGKEIETGARNKKGIVPLDERFGTKLVEALLGDTAPITLKALHATLYTITAHELSVILDKHSGLVALAMTVRLEPTPECKRTFLEALASCNDLEQVEIVVFPSLDLMNEISSTKSEALKSVAPSAEEMKALTKKCPKLTSLKMNIMKTDALGVVEWNRGESSGGWEGGLKQN
ncbi:MAG: hypothetical protein M4579_005141 [Chaenotheca gracillima]|nr:MAG: hypothetical protein M4579_005141 [Chaenotheca gracillima]